MGSCSKGCADPFVLLARRERLVTLLDCRELNGVTANGESAGVENPTRCVVGLWRLMAGRETGAAGRERGLCWPFVRICIDLSRFFSCSHALTD